MAKLCKGGLKRMKTKCGTYGYLAPEVLTGNGQTNYTEKVDCWSLGKMNGN